MWEFEKSEERPSGSCSEPWQAISPLCFAVEFSHSSPILSHPSLR